VTIFLEQLKGLTGQIFRPARVWYQWTGLSKGMSRFKFLIFNFDLEFLKEVQSFKALTAKIYLIINGLGGQQVLMYPYPNSNRKSINEGTTAGFVKRSAVSSSE
jgi:hypothetical protein